MGDTPDETAVGEKFMDGAEARSGGNPEPQFFPAEAQRAQGMEGTEAAAGGKEASGPIDAEARGKAKFAEARAAVLEATGGEDEMDEARVIRMRIEEAQDSAGGSGDVVVIAVHDANAGERTIAGVRAVSA